MKCREFDRDLSDWVAGRVPPERDAQMEAHRAACAVCARAAVEERDLRARWRNLPPAREAPDLWPRLAARLAVPAPAPRFPFARRYALGGALAAAAALVALFALLSPSRPEGAAYTAISPPVDEGRVVQLVADMQRLPDPDTDMITGEQHEYRQNVRFLLTGGRP